jgi:small subunit ribosomal protein S3Ae
VRDKWRGKSWYKVVSPPYFGGVVLGVVPSEEPKALLGRVIDATLYDITDDFSQLYMKMYFQVTDVDGKTAHTVFKGHEYSRDYLRSMVRRRTTRVEGLYNVTTKDSYQLRLAVSAFSLTRIKTSQQHAVRSIMKRVVEEKAKLLTFDQFVQEAVLGKIASDIYNEAKKLVPLRHVGVRKSKLVLQPSSDTQKLKETQKAPQTAKAD